MRHDPAEAGTARLAVRMRHHIGALVIDVEFCLTKPWTVLFGPSGSGKTTILRAIAGLEQPDTGSIVSGRRPIPLAPQSPSLFPHWNVTDNLTMRRSMVHTAIAEMLSLFRLESLRDQQPSELSGGEAQRVNMARAAAWAPPDGLLLLDEPFSGMDIALRDEIMRDLQVCGGGEEGTSASSLVTHDVAEAFQLGAEVIKIAEGKVVAQGPVEVVLAEERGRLLKQLLAGGC